MGTSPLATNDGDVRTIHFTIDSALLRELGERLVGKPHIALAELIKNSYDADATSVLVRFGPDSIEVLDDGDGMDFGAFQNFWMRVGSTHKQEQRQSPTLHRPVTGSKGIGRLASQFLARQLMMRTATATGSTELTSWIRWDDAVQAGELTQAQAQYRLGPPAGDLVNQSKHGTGIVLTNLNHKWDAEDFEDLAREIWALQPPFRPNPLLESDAQARFQVVLEGVGPEAAEKFGRQLTAHLDLWHARVTGRLSLSTDGLPALDMVLEFADGQKLRWQYPVGNPWRLKWLEYEIRVFHLQNRLRYGVPVGDLRTYLRTYGGVHVYDAGFHLPYYGAETDWLSVERDHSHRLSRSALLPDYMQVTNGMTFLPTNARIFGVVHVDTGREAENADRAGGTDRSDHLMIQVSRDRLVDNPALRDLVRAVRLGLDYYATQEAKRVLAEQAARAPSKPAVEYARDIRELLASHRMDMPAPVFTELTQRVGEAVDSIEQQARQSSIHAGMLGALATAGVTAVAFQHEAAKEYSTLERYATRLHELSPKMGDQSGEVAAIAEAIVEWVERARQTFGLFAQLASDDAKSDRRRLRAKAFIDELADRMAPILRVDAVVTTLLDPEFRLPSGRLAEWSAVFQNLLVNASNAMLDRSPKLVQVRARSTGVTQYLYVEDMGVGVDLETADELFDPFVRRLKISDERRALGLGGTGLGLTIVRMICGQLGVAVAFVEPSDGFATSVELKWTEKARRG